ncbi:MAG: leucine-rich repeat protein, partial [Spirochaetes bacterium]|nr:leucine-rich repeat protein [Spirochaetota bacterium]
IGNYAFTDCSNLDTLRVNAVEPPDVAPYVFKGCSKLTKIEVPSASVSNYKSASGWKDFDDMIVGF